MSHDFQAEVRFLGIKPSPACIREPEGNGCVERFLRTLKEQLLWIRTFDMVAELHDELESFRHRHNNGWLVEKHGFKTPASTREALAAGVQEAA